jgi:hypothetical protein
MTLEMQSSSSSSLSSSSQPSSSSCGGSRLWWRCFCAAAVWTIATARAALVGGAFAGDNCSYVLSGAGNVSVDGCYVAAGLWDGAPLYDQHQEQQQQWHHQQHQRRHHVKGGRGGGGGGGEPAKTWQLFQWEGIWRLGVPGVVALYSASCASAWPPPASEWSQSSLEAAAPPPSIKSASASTPVGSCTPTPLPGAKNCSCAACQALWGPQHNGTCPDLHTVAPDLVRPAMLADGTPPGPGRRVKAVEPSFVGTQAYHALYLPEEWTFPSSSSGGVQPGEKKEDEKQMTKERNSASDSGGEEERPSSSLWPVIVEYMGNGPWHDDTGDYSSGRPEDSNLGFGIGAGRKFVAIVVVVVVAAAALFSIHPFLISLFQDFRISEASPET